MARRNDITPVGDGSVGIDPSIQDVSAKKIQQAVSENNLKWQLKENSSMKGVYESVLDMVRYWYPADKMLLLSEYGDPSRISKSPSNDELDQALATVLVASLSKEDLKKIIGEQETKSANLARDVRKTISSTASKNKRYFRTGDFNKQFNDVSKNASSDNQLLKSIKKSGFDFKIDKWVKKDALPQLRKEIISVLSGFRKIDLAITAEAIGVDFEDGISEKELRKNIANKINLYVTILMGKEKGVSHMALDQSEIEAMEEILALTSFAWLTGKPGIGPKELGAKRQLAKNAKKQMEAQSELARERVRALKGNKFTKHFRKNSGKNRFSRGMGRTLFQAGVLKDLTDDEYRQIAEGLGIQDANSKEIEALKAEVHLIIGSEENALQKDERQLAKLQSKDNLNDKDRKKIADLQNKISIKKKESGFNKILEERNKAAQDFSDQIPVVTLNESGKIASEAILKAVPVVIVGEMHGGRIQSKKEASDARSSDTIRIGDDVTKIRNSLFGKMNSFMKTRGKVGSGLFGFGGKYEDEYLHLNDTEREALEAINNLGVSLKSFGSRIPSDMGTLLKTTITTTKPDNIKTGPADENVEIIKQNQNSREKRVTTGKKGYQKLLEKYGKNGILDLMKQGRERKNDNKYRQSLPIETELKKLSSLATYFKKSAVEPVTSGNKSLIIPVLDLNKSHDATLTINDNMKKSTDHLEFIRNEVSGLKNYLLGMQQVGTSVNSVAVAGSLQKILEIAGESGKALNEAWQISANANGGNLTASPKTAVKRTTSVSNISRIITGDHPKNKNNTEMVSVDWSNKKINVKPIPTTKSNKLKNSNLSSKQELSPSERNAPLSVGINTGLVYYNKTLNDVTDDGSRTALKVYSVNSPISEKVKIGDSEVSLIDLVYGIYSSIPTLVSALTTSNTLLTTISANTSKTASNVLSLASSGSGKSYSFPSNLDSVLEGM